LHDYSALRLQGATPEHLETTSCAGIPDAVQRGQDRPALTEYFKPLLFRPKHADG
jgi:hypothetical protein